MTRDKLSSPRLTSVFLTILAGAICHVSFVVAISLMAVSIHSGLRIGWGPTFASGAELPAVELYPGSSVPNPALIFFNN